MIKKNFINNITEIDTDIKNLLNDDKNLDQCSIIK